MLLEDLRALFSERGTDRLASADIVATLGCLEARPWSEWKAGKPITVRQLARLLEPFGVTPGTIPVHTGGRCKAWVWNRMSRLALEFG